MYKSKQELFVVGVGMLEEFAAKNSIKMPGVKFHVYGWRGYYRNGELFINLKNSMVPGRSKFCYSFPGNTADITPVGVLAHEFGHYLYDKHLDRKGKQAWDLLVDEFTKERVTSYEPNNEEKFAESTKLFVTNPSLLLAVAPNRHRFLAARFAPTVSGGAVDVLRSRGAYPHIIVAAENKLKLVR